MSPVRVALVGIPCLMRDILRSIIAAAAFPVLVISDYPGTLSEAAEEGNDIVVTLSGLVPESAILAVLRAHSLVRVLVLEERGRSGFLYELRPERTFLGELSEAIVLDTVRASRRPTEFP
ncbi:MAG: hypothetical protein JO243_10225 [Solirubrobacterales bacterium]|nr:hypothetical protein [Solirubrobacterales bacterium]